MFLTILVGYYKFKAPSRASIASGSVAGGPGGIQSIPGSANPTAQYAYLQEKQNIDQAKKAVKSGASSIPTIVRSQAFGGGVEAVGPQGGKGPLGFSALTREDNSGPQLSLWIQQLKASNCSKKSVATVLAQGAGLSDLKNVCSCSQLKDNGYPLNALQQICSCLDLKAAGYNATQFRAAGYSVDRLKQCGFDACRLKAAGLTAQQLKDGGFSDGELKGAGYSDSVIGSSKKLPAGISEADILKAGCQVDALKKLRAQGVSAGTIKQISGCSAAELKAAGFTAKELKDAGFSAKQLKDAGFSAKDLKDAGFSAKDLKDAGFSAKDLKDAGFSAKDLKDAGFSAKELKAAGFSAKELKAAGFSAKELKAAGFSAKELKAAGFSAKQLDDAGFSDPESQLEGLASTTYGASIPSLAGGPTIQSARAAANEKQLSDILNRQKTHMAEQQYQQKIQQRTGLMTGAANQALQGWKTGFAQVLIEGPTAQKERDSVIASVSKGGTAVAGIIPGTPGGVAVPPVIRAGEVLFAVLDTSVNSDEPGPILATIVAGQFKGAKLIGSFTLPTNADKMVISFNMMSVPGASKTTGINAYAIDPNTARTALSSRTDHHYLMRYGSLFAATFLEGFGNAFQSAGTTVTIGSSGATTSTTVSNGVGRSVLENAVIGLATLGQSWGQVAMKQVNTPVTVDVYSGTGLGILFTQDVAAV